jgi:competence protein ComFC
MSLAGFSQKRNFSLLIYNILWTAMDWLYPPECSSCGQSGSTFCTECQSKLRLLSTNTCKTCGLPLTGNFGICNDCRGKPQLFTEMRSWVVYEDPIREAIHDLKYRQNISLGFTFAVPLIGLIQTSGWPIDLILPVPISRSHYKRRGYNQSALISRPIARSLGIAHSSHAIRRVKETEDQTTLTAKERMLNMEDALLGIPAKLKGRNVLIVDDVVTTGATMQNCAKAILEAGAYQVFGISVARSVLQVIEKK